MSAKTLKCVECGRSFTWSEGEQRYYRERGLSQPKRCPACRSQRQGARSAHHAGQQPVFRFGLVALIAAGGLAAVLALGLALDGVLSWLLGINLVALLAYGYDKLVAGSKRTRVPEVVLLGLAVVGGIVGAVAGMVLFRHKIAKGSFRLKLALIFVVQIALVAVCFLVIKGQL